MVDISDIPCVGKAVDRISDATVDAWIRGLRYLFCYKSIVNNLNSEIEKVKVQEDRVSRKAVAESADGKTIEDHVIKWQQEVQEIKTRADELSKQGTSWNCFNVMQFPNPVTRFRLGRKAALEAKNIAELTVSGEKLLTYEIAHLPEDENIPISDTTYQKFGSREEAYGKLWEALVKVDGPPMIGIYGMPGVGKTRMMEQAWEDAKVKKIFNKVTRANVGDGNIDVIKLQNQLGGYLDCHFELEDNALRRASQLKNSLINGGKILIVLDDVWDPIPIKNIGIPLDDDIPKGCKILLTSRREDVCLRNGCTDPIKIDILTVDEAWDMFKSTVGTSKIDSLHDKSLAEKVCKECAGLPLLIHSVGNALKFVTEDSWKDALFQLENCNFDEIDGIESRVYSCIQLSIDHLTKAAKTCLLLCSLFPEDTEIEIKMLVDLATGSHLLNRGRNIRGVVDNLKSSSLLLKGESDRTVKLHDIIRDVARSIAARYEQYAFLFISGGSCFPDIVNCSTRKLLQFVESDKFRFPTGMVCPYLHTLWLECNNKPQQFPDSFFKGIVNLKILVLKGMRVFPEQMFIQTFDNLTVLILEKCDLNEKWLSFVPENLETLRILSCRFLDPLDLSKLKSLKKVEVVSENLTEMVPNAISTLPPTLEELHIPGGFRICDAEGNILMSISKELNKLTALTSLNICLEDSKSCPNETIVTNLLNFIIVVGGKSYHSHDLDKMRSVIFIKGCIEGGGEALVERAEEVILSSVKGSQNGLSSNNIEAYSNLETLSINDCEDMEHLVAWTPQYEIQQIQPLTSFSKLTQLDIITCTGLKYLFSASVAECLVQLEYLYISKCPKLEVVIRNESAGLIINFPKLKYLILSNLKSLTRFYGESRANSSSSTIMMENAATTVPAAGSESLFKGMVRFPNLVRLDIVGTAIIKLEEIELAGNDSTSKITSLRVECDEKVKLPSKWQLQFPNIEYLYLKNCWWHGISGDHNLGQSLCNPCETLSFQRLEVIDVYRCGVSALFSCSVFMILRQLKWLGVHDCLLLEEIVREENTIVGTSENTISLFQLKSIELYNLPELKSFGGSASYGFNLPALESIILEHCPKMEYFSRREISTQLIPNFNNQNPKTTRSTVIK